MKRIINLLFFTGTLLLILFMNTNKDKDITAIKAVLTEQQECWNNGDINSFMQGYWNSPKLQFRSNKNEPTSGWKATLERYKKNYPTKESMGELKFETLNIELFANNTLSKIEGKWELIRKTDNPKGKFWLELHRFGGDKWVIVKDSTISF